MSFVEWDANQKQYKPMLFKFAGRELKYMNGWLNILGAMRYVIDDVKDTMLEWDQAETDELIKILIALDDKA